MAPATVRGRGASHTLVPLLIVLALSGTSFAQTVTTQVVTDPTLTWVLGNGTDGNPDASRTRPRAPKSRTRSRTATAGERGMSA